MARGFARAFATGRRTLGRAVLIGVIVPFWFLPQIITAPYYGAEAEAAVSSDDDGSKKRRRGKRKRLRKAQLEAARLASMDLRTPYVPIRGSDGSKFRIDRYEYPNAPGQLPRTGVTPDEAQALCAETGGHLCTVDEWYQACSNGGRGFYMFESPPYDTATVWRVLDSCNLAGLRRETQLLPAGEKAECLSDSGVFDLSGFLGSHIPAGVGQLAGHAIRNQSRQALQRANVRGHPDIDLAD